MAYFICGLAALFYVYDFIIRILPGTLAHHLLIQYNISAAGLGFLSSFFFFGYIIMQIPSGILYDRFGPRIILTITILLTAIATFFFVATHSFTIAALARFSMGFGSAFAYIGALVLASRWLPLRYYALSAGMVQLMGSMGAIIGEAPIAKWVDHSSSLTVIKIITFIGIMLAGLFWLFIKDYPSEKKPLTSFQNKKIKNTLKTIVQNPQNWSAAFFGLMIWAPIDVFASLWAVPFLMRFYMISNAEAALLASFLWIGVGLGGPFWGYLSNRLESRRVPLLYAASLGLFASLMLLYFSMISKPLMEILLLLFGIAGSAQALTFGIIQDNNPEQSMGTATGFNNMAIILGGAVLQPIVGLLIKWHSDGKLLNSVHFYSIADFRFGLIILPICFLLSLFIGLFFILETHCRQPLLAVS